MADTRLTSDIELDGLSMDGAFAILGNETRLNIIRVLWEASALRKYDEIDDSDLTISFSELRHAVGIRDNGQFNYHLSKLVPHFVRHTDEGYRLSSPGKKIARTIIATSSEQPDVSNELQTACPLCGASITVAYEDQWLRFTCTDCNGIFGDAAPDGTIYYAAFPAAGLTDWTLDKALTVGLYRCMIDLVYMMRGICRECASPIMSSISICKNHDVDGRQSCDVCGTAFMAWAELRCGTCQFAKRLPVELCVMGLTPVIGILYKGGFDVLSPSFQELTEVIQTQFQTSVTRDPLRVRITIKDETDELTITFDDEMTLVDITR